MIKSDTPRLCGGTFFVLLLQTRIPRIRTTNLYSDSSNAISDSDMLANLISIIDPHFFKPAGKTFTSNTSSYKSCNISQSIHLPFEDVTIVKAFDDTIKSDYYKPLLAMSEFISTFISIENNNKCIWLVKALLELIETDDSIDAETPFHILENGKAVTKNEISTLTDICLQPFILGIWHFIVVNRPNNEIGQGTFAQWHETPETSGQQHKFISNIGDSITRSINIRMFDPDSVNIESEPEVIIEEDFNHTNSTEEPFSDNPAGSTINQTINNPIVFNQTGNNNIQIGNISTLTINNS